MGYRMGQRWPQPDSQFLELIFTAISHSMRFKRHAELSTALCPSRFAEQSLGICTLRFKG